VGDIGPAVLRDREILARDGFVVAIVKMDKRTGRVIGKPRIISRGLVFVRDSEELLERAREEVLKSLRGKESGDRSKVERKMRNVLREFFYDEIKRRPMVIPVVVD